MSKEIYSNTVQIISMLTNGMKFSKLNELIRTHRTINSNPTEYVIFYPHLD